MLDSPVRPPQLTDYAALLRRQWWLIALVTVIGAAAGYWYNTGQPEVYAATTQVLVTPTGAPTDAVAANARTRAEINLDTEAQLLTSTAVVERAATEPGISIPASDLTTHVRVSVPPNTEVLTIRFSASTPEQAQAGATAFAAAYLANRRQAATDELAARQESARSQVSALTATLQEVTTSLATLAPDTAGRAVAEAQVQSLSDQITILTAAANALESTPVTPGRTITDATLPSGPSSPIPFLNVAGGAMLGLLLGCALALIRQRTSRRLHAAADVTRLTGLPVLATIPTTPGTWLVDGGSAAGNQYVRLRNIVLASVPAEAQVFMVAGTNADGSKVADNLAATLARTGAEVVLVSTHAGSSTSQRWGLPQRWSGLSEVLGQPETATTALQVPGGVKTLYVLTPGQNPGQATELLETEAAPELLARLRRSARFIILDAPPTRAGGQAQTLAALSDAVIVVVHARASSADDVQDAVDQLHPVHTSLLGCVLLAAPRRPRRAFSAQPGVRSSGAAATALTVPSRPAGDDADPPAAADAPEPERAAEPAAEPSTAHNGEPRSQTKRSARVPGHGDTQQVQGSRPSAATRSAAQGAVSRSAR